MPSSKLFHLPTRLRVAEVTTQTTASWENAGLVSILQSPFLIPSIVFHTLLFLLLLRVGEFRTTLADNPPIAVTLLEFDGRGKDTLSVGPAKGTGGPRELPKKGIPVPPVKQTGIKSNTAIEKAAPAAAPQPAPPVVEPVPPPRATYRSTFQTRQSLCKDFFLLVQNLLPSNYN